MQAYLTYREPGITEREPAALDNLAEHEPKSPMIASPAADNLKPLHVVIGHLDADGHQVDIGVPRQPPAVSERERDLVMLGRGLGRFLPGGADGDDFELRQRA